MSKVLEAVETIVIVAGRSESKNARVSGKWLGRLPWASFCLAVLTGLSGCKEDLDPVVAETFSKICPADGNVRITIQNMDGSIRIYGADTKEVRIEAIKQAYGQERLKKIAINVADRPDSISIETMYPPRPKWGFSDRSGTVDYILVVPQTATIARLELTNGEVLIDGMRTGKVNANLVNGRLFDHNGFGQHELFVANGGLDIGFDWWEERKFSVAARIVNGNARAFIPSESDFHLLAVSADGNVTNDFSEQADRHGEALQKIDAQIGEPSDVVIQINATHGNINVVEANP